MEQPDANHMGYIEKGKELSEEKKFYFNGFALAVTANDCTIVLHRDNAPIAYIQAPHTIAKTLGESLENTFSKFETETGIRIFTLDEIKAAIDQASKKDEQAE